MADWFYLPSWKRAPPLPAPAAAQEAALGHWLVFADSEGLGACIGALLRQRGHRVSTVVPDAEFNHVVAGFFTLRPGNAGDMDALVRVVCAQDGPLTGVVHCWGVSPADTAADAIEAGLELNFFSLLDIVQALQRAGHPELRRVAVVTRGAQRVSSEETPSVLAAASLGAVRVLPAESPRIRCSHIDVQIDDDGVEHLATHVLPEILSETPEPVVALRRNQRWLQFFEPVRLDPPVRTPALLRPRGTYLITGGLGGVGLATAEYLARTVQARLVLTGRTPFPPRDRWDALSAMPTAAPMPDAGDFIGTTNARLERELGLTVIDDIPDLKADLDAVCSACGFAVLERLADAPLAGRSIGRGEWIERAGVAPAYVRLFDALLRWQIEDGRARRNGDRIAFDRAAAPDAAALLVAARARHPRMRALFDMIEHCARHCDAVLDGSRPGVEVLFGEASKAQFRAAGEVILEHSLMRIHHHLLRELVRHWLAGTEAASLRVLEVGAGEGHLAWTLAPVLAGHDVEYHFTDVGRGFVRSAEREAQRRGIDFMRFAALDLERNLADQDYPDDSVDLVLAFNVVHATRRIGDCLERLRRVLRPGGALVMIESLRTERCVDWIWGLTEGWWHYEDGEVRGDSPLLGAQAWRAALAHAGFTAVVTSADDCPERPVDAALILARKPSEAAADAAPHSATAATIEQLRRIEALGSEVMLACADVSDSAAMRTVIAEAEARFGSISGVIHSALVLNDSAAALKTRAEAAAVFAPKVQGTLVLIEALRGRDLDFFIAYSSLAAFIGVPGQIDYSAASNVVDAIALAESDARTPLARFVGTIAWGAWRDTGMAARLAARRGARARAALEAGMSTDEGIDALARMLTRPLPQVAVSSERLDALLQAPSPPAGRADEPAAVNTVAPAAPEVPPDPGFVEPRDAPERAIAALWEELLGIPQVGAEDNFFELGGDSVIGLQFIARAAPMGMKISNKDLFQHQTVAALAAVCARSDASLGAADVATDDTVPTKLDATRFPAARANQADIDRLVSMVTSDSAAGVAGIEDVYELAPMQQGMLFHTLDAPDTGVYCSRLSYTLRGPLDGTAFARAWQDVVDRHPILRSSFHHEELAKPLQVVHRHADVAMMMEDWRDLDETARERRLSERLHQEGQRGFELGRAPLLRLALIRWDENDYRFVLVHHHLLMDGWCRSVLFEDLFRFYEGHRTASPPQLPPPHRYREFIEWLQRQDLGQAEAFWRRELAGFRTPTPIAGDQAPSPGPGEVHEHRFELDTAASAALQAELRSRRLTLGTAVSGTWALWLACQAGSDDVVFGATVAGRPASLANAEAIIGLFINTLPVRARIERDTEFGAWLAEFQVAQAEARQYEHTPLSAVQDWAETPRSARLFESLVVLENSAGFAAGPERHGDIEIAATRPVIRNSYPLTLRVVPATALQLQLLYDRSRFSADYVASIANDVLALLRAVASAETTTIGTLVARLDEARRSYDDARVLAFKDGSRKRLESIKRRKS